MNVVFILFVLRRGDLFVRDGGLPRLLGFRLNFGRGLFHLLRSSNNGLVVFFLLRRLAVAEAGFEF